MDSFRVIIAGCRDFNDYELLREKCDYMLSKKKDTHKVIIVSGHAAGADALGEVYASERGFGLEDAWLVPCEMKEWRGWRMRLLLFGTESPEAPRT